MSKKSLNDIALFSRGLTYKKIDVAPHSSNIVLRANNIKHEKNNLVLDDLVYIKDSLELNDLKKIKKGSSLMCISSGSKKLLGKSAFIDKDYNYYFGAFLGMISPKENIYPKYLFYLLNSKKTKDHIFNLTDGMGINNLKFDDIKNLKFLVPSFSNQKRIVEKLDTCMEQIDKAIKNVEKKIHNAEELFQSQLNEVLSSKKDGWIEKKLGEVCKLITKGTTPTSVGYKFIDEGINFVKAESIALDGSFIQTKFAHISIDCHNKLKRSQLKEGDIIFSIAGVLGRTAIVTDEILPANTNQALSILRLKNDVDIDVKYLLYALSNKDALEQVKSYGGGTAQQNLSLTQMKSFKLTFPTLHIQNQIVLKLDRTKIITKLLKFKYQNELKALNELKQSILEKAFNGEL